MSMPSDGARFTGLLTSGRSADAAPVSVRIAGGGLELRLDDERQTKIWPYDKLFSAVPLDAEAPDVLLSLEPNAGETLFVNNPSFAAVVLARAPALSAGRRRWQGLKPGLAVVACILALVGAGWAAGLQPSRAVARLLPHEARAAMGQSVVQSMASGRKVCETPASRAALDRLTGRLLTAASDAPPTVRVVILDWPIVNAFAAPGGQIVLARGLIQRAGSPDEVAGVLAHELGHTLELHPEAGIIRVVGLSAAAQLMFAGSSGRLTDLGVVLAALRYSRIAEREADTHALRILKGAGISPKGFADFFERIEAKPSGNGSNGGLDLSVLSTHPATAERIAMARAQAEYQATPAVTAEDWKALREACGTPPPATPRAPSPATVAAPAPAPQPPTSSPSPQPGQKRQPANAPKPSASAPKNEAPASSEPRPAQREAANTPAPQTPPPAPKIDPQADRDIAEATKAIVADPKDVDALQKRARAYARKGDHDAALTDYATAIEVKPQDAELHYGRGTALQNLRRYEEAVRAYDEVLRLSPANANARNNRGNVFRVLKRYDAALQDFDEVIRSQPEFVHGLYNRGLVYREMERYEDAVRDFTATIGKDKGYTAAYTSRGIAHEKMGAQAKAVEDFRAALAVTAKYNNGAWAHNTARERLKALGEAAP